MSIRWGAPRAAARAGLERLSTLFREAAAGACIGIRLGVLVALPVGVATTACGPASGAREESLQELEQLAFVPSGSVRLPARQGPDVVCENLRPLLVDRFEVPRSRWLRYQRERMADPDPILVERTSAWSEDSGSWAASWMTLEEARGFAAARGMRLPTAREWLRVAAGSRGLPYPWGQTLARLVANTVELALARPVAVGTFELGATPFSTYEMCGNVWEWVEDPIDRVGSNAFVDRANAWALGGSFTSPLRRLYDLDEDGRLVFDHLDLDPCTRGDDIGLRCVADASEYLSQRADSFGNDESTRARLVAVGRRFGRDAVPLLEELAGSKNGSPAMRLLLEGAQR